jgi:RNA polymerase sigma factor for flagellar operon FliA
VAIQFGVSLSKIQQLNDRQKCRRRRGVCQFRRRQACSTSNLRTTKTRGPSHDWADSNDLVVKLLPLVKRVALQFRGRLPAHVELDDLISDGTVGLIDAVRKFDPARGVTIESYARYRIRGAILDSLRDQDHASRDMRRRIKKIESTCQALERRLGRPAEDTELARAMGLSLEQWYGRVAELRRLGFEGTGSRIPQEFSKRVNEEDLPAAQDDNPFTLCYRREQRDLLSRALGCLKDRERSIITLYYKEAWTMKQIGSRLGIDESRVSQLHSSALARLRSKVADTLRPVPDGTRLRRPAPGPEWAYGQRIGAARA